MISKSAGDNAKELAERLLEQFGTVVAVLKNADTARSLADLVGATVAARLAYLADALDQSLKDAAVEGLRVGSLEDVMHYLRVDMAHHDREVFRALFLDADNRLIADQVMWTGTVDRVQAHVRELIREALQCGSAAVLVVHNHVAARPAPSPEDILFTKKLCNAFAHVDLQLVDHVIVARLGCYSMRAAGVLREVSNVRANTPSRIAS